MMTDTKHRGGWGRYDHLSPSLRARCIADDREFQQACAAAERARAERAEYDETQRIRAAIAQAEERGEYVSLAEVHRTGGANLGHTRAEFIAYISALQDVEDARTAAKQRASGPDFDPQQHQELLIAANPTLGRTRREAVAYYSALGDLQEMEAARRRQLGQPSVEQEQATAVLAERRDSKYSARALAHRIGVIAKFQARRAVVAERERQFLAGEITEAEFVATCQAEDAA